MVSKRLKTHYLRSYDQFLKNGFTIVFLTKKGGLENAILTSERALTAVGGGGILRCSGLNHLVQMFCTWKILSDLSNYIPYLLIIM